MFTVKATWTIDGKETVKEYELPADGTVVNGPQDLPVGTKVTFNEVKVPNLDGYTFTGVEFSPKTVTVNAGETVHVSATNTYKKGEGGMAVTGANGVSVIAGVGFLLLLAGGATYMVRRRGTIQ